MSNLLALFGAQISGLADNLPKVDAAHSNIATIFNALYVIAGMLAIIFIIVGGIRYTLAGGEASKISQAKSTILYSVVGLVIVILAFSITNFILSSVRVDSWMSVRDSIINTLLYAAGIIAVIMIIYGAFRYITAGGNAGAITKAKDTILFAVIGLVIAILAFTIVNFVIGSF